MDCVLCSRGKRICHSLDFFAAETRVQIFGTGDGAIENIVAHIDLISVLVQGDATVEISIKGLDQPTIGLQQDSRAEELLTSPPVHGARASAAGAEDALINTIESVTILLVDFLLQVPTASSELTEAGSTGADVHGDLLVIFGSVTDGLFADSTFQDLLVHEERRRELSGGSGERSRRHIFWVVFG